MANIIQTFPAGAGSGHTILDGDGTAVAQEKNLKITGLSVTDSPSTESTDLAPAGLNQDSIDDIAGASLPGTVLVGSGLNYSTSEQIVGRWLNGKPLYQKCWYHLDTDIVLPSNTWVNAPHISLANVDALVDCRIISDQSMNSPSAYYLFAFQYGWNRDANYLMIQNIRTTDNSLGVDGRYYHVIIQYTKTTD